jgi:hypothetical protein
MKVPPIPPVLARKVSGPIRGPRWQAMPPASQYCDVTIADTRRSYPHELWTTRLLAPRSRAWTGGGTHYALRQLLRRHLGAGSDGVHQVSALLILARQQRHELRKWWHANSSMLHGSAPSMLIARPPAELLT